MLVKMKMTIKFYIDKAKYRAEDSSGKVILVNIDYWNNSFELSGSNKRLERVAKDLLKRKHKVNFADKLLK